MRFKVTCTSKPRTKHFEDEDSCINRCCCCFFVHKYFSIYLFARLTTKFLIRCQWSDVMSSPSLSLSFPPFEFESNGKELDHPVYISPNEMSSPLIYWFVNTDLSLLSTFFKYRNNCRFFTWIFLQIFWIALRVQYIYLLYIRMYVRE